MGDTTTFGGRTTPFYGKGYHHFGGRDTTTLLEDYHHLGGGIPSYIWEDNNVIFITLIKH